MRIFGAQYDSTSMEVFIKMYKHTLFHVATFVVVFLLLFALGYHVLSRWNRELNMRCVSTRVGAWLPVRARMNARENEPDLCLAFILTRQQSAPNRHPAINRHPRFLLQVLQDDCNHVNEWMKKLVPKKKRHPASKQPSRSLNSTTPPPFPACKQPPQQAPRHACK